MSDTQETEELQELDLDELIKLQEREKFKQFENFVKSRETAETEKDTKIIEVKEVTQTKEVPIVFDALLRPASVARMLAVTTSTLRLWYKTGLLSAVITAGGHLRVRASEVARLQGQPYTPPQPVNDPYKDPTILAEAQQLFLFEEENSIFSVENLQKAITSRNVL